MPTPLVEKILILQDRDRRRRELEAQLQAVPREIASVEARIAAEKAAIETARAEMKDLEAKKKVVETEIGSAEQKAARYRSQQLEVRKNDEYRALGQEIETTVGEIGALEGRELELMYAIDEAKKRFAAAEQSLRENISGHETRIKNLKEREKTHRAELETALAALAAAREPVDAVSLKLYDRIASRSFPACVPVVNAKCGGCHLKISSESETASRGKEGGLGTCDQCGRIIYMGNT